MRFPDRSRRRLILAAGSSALLGACAMPTAVPAPASPLAPPRVRVGDRWRYGVVDLYRNQLIDELTMQVITIEPQLRLSVTASDGSQRSQEVYVDAWRAIQDPFYDLTAIFRAANPLLPSPLQQGANLRLTNAWKPPGKSGWLFWSEWIDALQWELVSVPAGDFTALRVLRRIAYDHPDVFRLSNERTETLWYAPQVNRWVRREWTGSYRWPGMRMHATLRDDWVEHKLLEYRPA
ncbi:MAG: hypothetical protein ACO3BH_00420 [Quisquiliibacterium sp.]